MEYIHTRVTHSFTRAGDPPAPDSIMRYDWDGSAAWCFTANAPDRALFSPQASLTELHAAATADGFVQALVPPAPIPAAPPASTIRWVSSEAGTMYSAYEWDGNCMWALTRTGGHINQTDLYASPDQLRRALSGLAHWTEEATATPTPVPQRTHAYHLPDGHEYEDVDDGAGYRPLLTSELENPPEDTQFRGTTSGTRQQNGEIPISSVRLLYRTRTPLPEAAPVAPPTPVTPPADPPFNSHNLTPAQIGEGYVMLSRSEMATRMPDDAEVWRTRSQSWSRSDFCGRPHPDPTATRDCYRTRRAIPAPAFHIPIPEGRRLLLVSELDAAPRNCWYWPITGGGWIQSDDARRDGRISRRELVYITDAPLPGTPPAPAPAAPQTPPTPPTPQAPPQTLDEWLHAHPAITTAAAAPPAPPSPRLTQRDLATYWSAHIQQMVCSSGHIEGNQIYYTLHSDYFNYATILTMSLIAQGCPHTKLGISETTWNNLRSLMTALRREMNTAWAPNRHTTPATPTPPAVSPEYSRVYRAATAATAS